MPKTKLYVLGPVSPWNSLRKENFVIAVNKLRQLQFDVDCCYDFLITDTQPGAPELFRKRLNKVMECDHVVLLTDFQTDMQATCIYNVANNLNKPIDSFNRFMDSYAKAPHEEKTT